ncbi:MAG: GAF domain-containing protein, partial [Thermomicrobiaceae bacterium]|nr:GAF domain-containing protein [Thermomicrobiaceae bacterium]
MAASSRSSSSAARRPEEERTKALLASERHVLELIARGASLPTVLETLVRTIERLSPGAICSILLLDGDRRLRHGAAPHLPPAYAAAIDGLAVGPDSGSCGAAAYYREPVVTADIASDPRWSRGRALALRHGLRACWSFPILATDGEVLGTFAIYFLTPRAPRPHDWQVIEVATHLAGIALERRRAEESLRKSTATLQGIINSGRQSIVVIGPDYRIQAFNDLALVSIKRGWGREIRVGDSLLDHLAGADRREIERIVPQVLAGQPVHREWRIPDRAGRAHWFELHFDPVRDHHGGVMAVCITAWPIDERKRAEEERARLFAREHAARTAAEAAHRRAALLAETSRVFVEASLDVHASFATIARQIADRLGDACVIRILDDDGRSLVPVASYHPDPALLGQLRDLLAKSPLGWGEGLQ